MKEEKRPAAKSGGKKPYHRARAKQSATQEAKTETLAPVGAKTPPAAPQRGTKKAQGTAKKRDFATHGSPQTQKREKAPAKKQAPKSQPTTVHTAPEQAKKPTEERTKKARPTTKRAPKHGAKLRIIPLGGLHEIGKNMTAVEYENDIIVVDCGFGFPDEDMLGVDYVIPDISYLEKNAARVRGIVITHGHEDHIGAIPDVLRALNVPIYGTRLTLGIIRNKLSEHKLPTAPKLMTVEAGDYVDLGLLGVEFIHVNHSIADACALAIHTPLGVVFHSGDFKLDVTPTDGNMMDLVRLGEIGREGVLLMLCESTNAERTGFSPSERSVGGSFEQIFRENKDNRLVIATFSSNVHRVQQIIDCSIRYGRRVAILGRSMENIIGAATELGYLNLPKGTLVDIGELRNLAPHEVTLITTGSQGEPMSGLYRMAFGSHDRVRLTPSDTVVLSSSAIPGNELFVGRIINALIKSGIKVVSDANTSNVHASGHACAEELKLMHALIKPRYFMPIHGETRHLFAHKKIAEFMGMSPDRIFIGELGQVLELDEKGARFNGVVPAGRVLVDGAGVGDVGAIVLRDRRQLSQDGLIVVVATVALDQKTVLSGPDIVSRGFVYVRESEEMLEGARKVALSALQKCFDRNSRDWTDLKNTLREDLSRYLYQKTKRTPVILPIVMDV